MVSVHEITMAAPDIVCVEVRDPEITKGPLVQIDTPETGGYSTAIERTNPISGDTEWCYPKGANKDYLKFHDIRATEYLDRDAADDESSYGTIGGLTVSDVYRKSIPYMTGICRNAAANGDSRCVSMKHLLYLKLSGNLAEGAHTIDFPVDTGLSDAAFTFNDQSTRCSSIHVNQVGHRPGDANKLAYLSVWIPGAPNEGAIQFSATKFYIIDEGNKIHFIGGVTFRTGPTDVEEDTGFSGTDTGSLHRWLDGLVRYRSTTEGPLKITAITKASSGVVTYSGSAFTPANDDIYCLSGIGGMTSLEGRFVKVSSVDTDAKTFAIDVNTTSLDDYVADTYLAAHDSLITKTHLASRAGTYVYGLDYSDWVGQPGLYRIWIPGMGVSDQFRIDEAIWYKVAENAAKGVYHHRMGMALDAFDYERPVCFKDGENGVEIYRSTLPAVFCSEMGVISPNIASSDGDSATWITSTRETGFFGSHMDAGDWDSFIYAHVASFYYLLTLGYEYLPSASRNTSFGIPKSSVTLGSTYTGTDSLPDAVHEAIWYLDAYRRLQRQDGAVGSGVGHSDGGLMLGSAGSGPSWLPAGSTFIYAPDHASNFAYAIGAGKLAIIFANLGLTTLENLWLQSADDAWGWAETIYQNASGERDAYYITELDIKTKASWDDATYTTRMASANTLALGPRRAAAGVMFRATGESTYGDVVKALAGESIQSWIGIAAWEYIHADSPDSTAAAIFSNGFKTGFDNPIVGYSEGDIAYRNQGFSANRGMNSGPSEYFGVIAGHILQEDVDKLATMQAGRGVVLGANQYGSSYTVGLGARTFTETLHEDSRRAGLDRAPTGITHYGWDFPGILLRVNNFTTDSPLNYVVELPTGDFETDFGTARLYEPHRLSVPFCEQTVESSLIIFHMEYTFHQSIISMWVVAMWLHAHDSNTQTEFTRGKPRLYSKWGSS